MRDRIWALKARTLELETLTRETMRACKARGIDGQAGGIDVIRMQQMAGIASFALKRDQGAQDGIDGVAAHRYQ